MNIQQAFEHHQAGRFIEAEAAYRQILQIKPDHPDALHLLGMVAHEAGRDEIAVELIRKAIRVKPAEPMYHNNLAMALETLGKLDEAAENFSNALLLKPGYARAHFNLGNILRVQGKLDAALASFHNAVLYQPDYAEAYNNLGNVLQEQDKLEEAVEHYRRSLSFKPDYAEAHNNLGNALLDQGKLDEAVAHFNRAIFLQPDYAEAHINLGNALKDLKQFDAALACYNKAIVLEPDYADAYNNRGNVLRDLKQPDAAFASYSKAIAIEPGYVDGHWNKALLFLLLGDFENGWTGYEWRWQNNNLGMLKRNFAQPLWLGKESLAGKTILLHSEQGLGDTIQFCRYARMVADLGAHVILEAKNSLLNLFTNLNGVEQLVANGNSLPAFDYHCPLLSLPLAFKTNMDSIPAPISYVTADANKVAEWQMKLGEKEKPRVGLVWSGNAQHKNDRNRSVSFSELLKFLPDDFQYVSLQKELCAEDQETLQSRPDTLHFGDELIDFSDTAALCELVDVVISVDTSVAHLAGALGKRVWILLPFIPDWRWLLDRSDSPWYPTAKLYRQETIGDWHSVFEKIKMDLIRQLQ